MAEVTLEQRFHGSVVLITLLLRRLAKSNDVDEGFAAARALKMIAPEHESFMRHCMALDASLQAGEQLPEPVTPEMVEQLQACSLRINSADPA